MEEMREHPNFGGTERSRREGPSHRECISFQLTMAAVFTVLLITAVAFAVQAFQPHPQPCAQCPFDWVGFRGKCYYFSEDESDWTASQNNCSALGASLAVFDSAEDLVQGNGLCAYLGDFGLSSSHCSAHRNWVCTKPALQNPRKNFCIST